MLANLKIIWQFHAHSVHQKVSRFLGRDISGTTFFSAESSLIQSSLVPVTPRIFLFDIKQKNPRGHGYQTTFNRTVVPYEISKVNFRVETKILVSMSEEM